LNARYLEFILQIITDVLSKRVPERFRSERLTLSEDSDKKIPELVSSLHMNSLSETNVPFPIILQKAMSETRFSVSGEKDTIHCPQGLEGSSASDLGKKGPEVKAFSSLWGNIQHPANGKSLFPWCPLMNILLPGKFLRKLLIKQKSGLWILLIGFEVSHQSGVSLSCSLNNISDIRVFRLIPGDILHVLLMNLQALHCRRP
jgi:hypothetical protein